MMRLTSLFIILAALFAASSSSAWVDVKNANFAMTRTDFEVEQSGPDLLLERTYNSRSIVAGFFGHGWCSNLESSLTVLAKGLAVYRHCGTGRAKIFKSTAYSAAEDAASLERLVKLVGEKMDRSAKIPNDFTWMLKADIELRATFAMNYGFTVPTTVGEKLAISNFPEATTLSIEKDKMVLREEDGDILEFDANGFLSKISDRHGQAVKLEWSKGRPTSLVDSRKNRIVFTTDAAGRITEARGPNREYKYRYSNEGDLVAVDGFRKESYKYDATHNLTSFKWGRAFAKVKYDVKNDRVAEVEAPDCTKTYRYDIKTSGLKMSVDLESKCKGKPRETVKYEFLFKETSTGRLYQAEMTATDSNKDKTAVRYADDNRPIWMQRRGGITEFSYDAKGRLARVVSPGGTAEYTYDQKGRLSSFKTTKGKSSKPREIKYAYASNDSLESTTDGAVVTKYTYDSQGRLASVSDNRGKKVELSHRSPASELPSAMKAGKGGSIDLTYATNGVLVPPRDDEALSRFVSVMTTYQELVEPGSEVLRKASEP